MRKITLNILKYILVFVLAVTIGFGLLVLTAKIPKKAIQNNMKESVQFYKDNVGIDRKYGGQETYLHYYADSILLNIIYNINSEKPVQSVLWSNYYETFKMDINRDFILTVEQEKKANTQYLRYWHGSMVILRPLFVIFNVNQIYALNAVLLWGLAIALFVLLFIRHKKLAFVYLLALIMATFYIVPKCFEYTWMFYIMFIVSIISILNEKKKKNSWFYMLFFITGIITCYLDFLTTEIITLFVPMLLVLGIRKKENRIKSFKDVAFFVVISSILWLIGYAGMWLAKWGLAGVILNINPIEYVKENMMHRIYGYFGIMKVGGFDFSAIKRNFWTLYPLVNVENDIAKIWIGASFVLIPTLTIDWNNLKNKWIAIVYLLIALAPYARYYVLTAHSQSHFFFTYRSQIITIIAVGLIFIECFNYKIIDAVKRRISKK